MGRALLLGASVLVGALTALQARLNGQLAATIGSGLETAVVSFGSGLVVLSVVAVAVPSVRRGVARVPRAVARGELRWWQILGGLLGGFFVAVQSATVPVVGVAVFTVASVAGVTANSLAVDAAGLGPAGRQRITPARAVAGVVAITAVVIAVSARLLDGEISIVAVGFALVAGAGTAIQQAINGRVARAAGSPIPATFFNFVFGTAALGAAFGLAWALLGQDPGPLPSGPWWIYAGGLIGIAFIAIAAWVVPIIGVLLFSVLSVAGSLSGALLLDIVAPTSGTHLSWTLFVGVAVAYLAVVIAARRPS